MGYWAIRAALWVALAFILLYVLVFYLGIWMIILACAIMLRLLKALISGFLS